MAADDGTENARKRQRRQIISEEEYTSSLESIIQRDYYGDVPDLQLKLAVLDRRSQNDHDGAVRVRRTARRIQEQQQQLVEQDTIHEQCLDEHGLRVTARPLLQEDLTNFHHRVTSEDNVEFDRYQEQEISSHRKKLEWKYQTPADPTKGDSDQNARALMPPPSTIPFRKSNCGDITSMTTSATATSTTIPPTTSSSSRKSVSAGEEMMSSQQPQQQQQQQYLVEYIPKTHLEKKIVPAQTRFPMSQMIATCLQDHRRCRQQQRATSSSSSLALERHIHNNKQSGNNNNNNNNNKSNNGSDTEYYSDTDASTDLESTGGDLHQERQAYARRKQRELETFVNMSPLVTPGMSSVEDEGVADCSIEGADAEGEVPFVSSFQRKPTGKSLVREQDFSAKRISTTSFTLSEENERDKAAKAASLLLEQRKARVASNTKSSDVRGGRNHNTKKSPSIISKPRSKRKPTNSSNNMSGISSFSPAAMALFAKSSKEQNFTARSRNSFASALRSSYTPQRASSKRCGNNKCK